MSLSSTMPIIEQQKKEVEEARRKYGDDAAKLVEKHQGRDVLKRFANGAVEATKSAAHGGGPVMMMFNGIKGFLLGGESGPTDEELRNAGKPKGYNS